MPTCICPLPESRTSSAAACAAWLVQPRCSTSALRNSAVAAASSGVGAGGLTERAATGGAGCCTTAGGRSRRTARASSTCRFLPVCASHRACAASARLRSCAEQGAVAEGIRVVTLQLTVSMASRPYLTSCSAQDTVLEQTGGRNRHVACCCGAAVSGTARALRPAGAAAWGRAGASIASVVGA